MSEAGLSFEICMEFEWDLAGLHLGGRSDELVLLNDCEVWSI